MRKWILKAIIQKVITYLPFSFHINYFFQRYITKGVLLTDDFFTILLGDLTRVTKLYQSHIGSMRGIKVLELGTGWHPIMSVGLFLTGAEEIVTTDLRKLIRKKNLLTLLTTYIRYYEKGRLAAYDIPVIPERVEQLRQILSESPGLSDMDMLQKMKIRQVVGDAGKLQYPAHYFDLTFSVNVFEHVHKEPLERIVHHFHSLTRPGGMAYHAIGPYDHFVHVDETISKFNYLQYSERQWQWIDNGIQPQNRLRIPYFRKLFLENNYQILEELFWDPEPLELQRIELHPDFQQYDPKENAIPYGTFVLQTPN